MQATNQDDNDIPSEDGVREPWWSLNFPILVLLGMFLFTALFVPTEWIRSLQELVKSEPVNVHETFAAHTAEVDAMLERGESVPAKDLSRLKLDICLRRIMRAGPMSEPHLEEAKTLLLELERQRVVETSVDGERTLERAMARKLAARFPRLDEEKLAHELERFFEQHRTASSKTTTAP